MKQNEKIGSADAAGWFDRVTVGDLVRWARRHCSPYLEVLLPILRMIGPPAEETNIPDSQGAGVTSGAGQKEPTVMRISSFLPTRRKTPNED